MIAAVQGRSPNGGWARVARGAVAVLLMITIGAPWAFLQTAAWVSMAVDYSVKEGSILSGLSQTFDGEHPCQLCEAAWRQAASDNDSDTQNRSLEAEKMNLILVVRTLVLTKPQGVVMAVPPLGMAGRRSVRPEVPPPRPAA